MPPRISPNRGVPRRGHTSRGGHPGGGSRGSQLGGSSSIDTAPATPSDTPGSPSSAATTTETLQIPAPITTNHPTARGQPSGNRGRGAGRGDAPDRGQLAARNRGRGRGRGRDASRGGTPGPPSDLETTSGTPITTGSTSDTPSIASFPQDQSAIRGQSFRGRGGYRGSTRGNFFDSPSPFRGRSSRGGRGGGGGFVAGPSDTTGSPSGIPDEIETFGAKRPGYGSGGRAVKIIINAFPTTVPKIIIYQYDVVVHDGKQPARLNMQLLSLLQQQEATVFTPKVVYDGQKILFSIHDFLGENDSQKFFVSRPPSRPNGPPKVYEIIMTKTSTINSELLQRFTDKNLSHNENVSTVLAALNVAVKMEPNQIHPFNKRSFYIPDGRKDIGGGIELWRGIFQSVRPTVGRLIVNIDLSTGMMYKEGPLLNLCIDFFGRTPNTSPNAILSGTSIRDIERHRLQKFLSGVRVKVSTTGDRERVIRGLSKEGADRLTFRTQAGVEMTVAQYFQSLGVPVQYPGVICALVGRTAMVPLEFCTVPRGQFMRKEIPDDKVRDILAFSTKKPSVRLESIKDGLQYLRYGQSEYVRNFGMTIEENPLSTNARIIEPPKLKYNAASRQPTIKPTDGAWNMIDKRFYEASTIVRWVVVIYDSQRNFPLPAYEGLVKGFLKACDEVGMTVENRDPIYKFEDGQGPIGKHLENAVKECLRQFKQRPTLIVVVLPENGGEIYNAVKHFGDITFGIPTQCLKAISCKRARPQYWNNVLLKVNVKLGGINVIPDPSSLAAEALTDPANPTIVMGADVMHPPPGVNRPSYSAIIGSVDSHTAKYVATSHAQTGKREIINDMQEMCKVILREYKDYRVNIENKVFGLNRLIFYRDGVSESEFKQVLELELPMIKAACEEFGVNPKITLIIVGKRHHIQFFPMPKEGDRKSENCFAGTVVDRDVTHPTDHDFYLLSHAGILGTSRPAHYSVLYDESGFNADALQSLSYSLCHVYAPSTRAVSVPAPVYYADLVCSRAKTHFDPTEDLTFDTSTALSGSTNLEAFKDGYKPLHANQQKAMYFA
jgi:eukaryotic translation initiation factor 2C